jgi:RHS repeat-associated protein
MLVYTSKVLEWGNPSNPQPDQLYQTLVADPSLGYGWNLAVGAVKKCGPQQGKLCYVSPDGAEHTFQGLVSNYAKTLDSSRYYLHYISASAGYEMWDEEGNRYVFDWEVTGFDDPANNYVNDLGRGRNGWYLRKIQDPFGNEVSFEYFTNLGVQPCWAGVCPDPPNHSDGTEHSYIVKKILLPGATTNDPTIEVTLGTDAQVPGVSNLVTKVTCKVSASTEADWLLDYQAGPKLVKLTLPPGASTSYDFTYTGGLLSTMRLPTGATISYLWGTYAFHHNRPGSIPPTCNAQDPPVQAVIEQSENRAAKGIVNGPTGEPTVPINPIDCSDDNNYRWTDYVEGVIRRTETVNGVNSSTDYDQWAFPFGERGNDSNDPYGPQTLTLVTYPADIDGRRQSMATLFTAGPRGTGPALPGGAIGADVRVAYYDHDPYPNPRPSSPSMPLCGGNLDSLCIDNADRVIYRTYEYADQTNKIGQRRLKSETTNYGKGAADDSCPAPCKYHKVEFKLSSGESWEGNGRHYNIEEHTGSSLATKTIATTWEPLPIAPLTTPWQPNLFTNRVVNDPGAIAGQQVQNQFFEFASDGFLKGELTWDQANGKLLVHCMYPDADGNADKEFWKTIAQPSAPPFNKCSTSYSGMPSVGTDSDSFGKDHGHEDGQLKTSCWIKGSACLPWLSFDVERDDVTGLTTYSDDPANERTTYAYDSLLRVTQIDPPGTEAATGIAYNSPNETVVTRNGGTGLSTNMRYTYDGLGRLIEERRLMPGSTYAYRHHKFDAAGHAYFDSEWTSSTSVTINANVGTACITSLTSDPTTSRPQSAPGTYRLCYDPFGRPQQVVGSNHSSLVSFDRSDGTNIANGDTQEKATSWCVNGTYTFAPFGCSGGSNPFSTTAFDVLGRALSVTEPTGDVTSYNWDVSGKVAKVTQAHATQGTQTRTFVYNALGFLTSETTPEVVGAVTRTYGALGNALQKTEGGVTNAYTYDAAGRLLTDSVGSTRYVMNCYDGTAVNLKCPDGTTDNFPGGDAPEGKLTRQIGDNPLYEAVYPTGSSSINTIADYQYSGLGGRLSGRTSWVEGGAAYGATESWVYNNLGLYSTHDHPRLMSGADSARLRESYAYQAGLPTTITLSGKTIANASIPGATITATYTPAGTLATYASNQTGLAYTQTTTITPDATLLPRPSRIASSIGGFDTGTYAYDGAGNVLSMTKDANNKDTFTYDTLSRISTAAYKVAGATTSQGFSYDRFGNLLAISGTGARSFCTTKCTNNKLPSPTTYDNAGNLTHYGSQDLSWDALSRQRKDVGPATWQYLYEADSERVARVPWYTQATAPAVTRRAVARYISQAEGWAPALLCDEDGVAVPGGAAARTFADVHCGDQDWEAIQSFYEEGISGGCGSGNFCPDTTVTRGQMMVFLLKVEHGSSYTPPPCVGNVFTDVTCAGQFDAWIEQASDEGLTGGCGTGIFCPNGTVSEWHMAAYLDKPQIAQGFRTIPQGSYFTLRDEQNRVVTEFYDSFPGRDNVYLGNLLVASYVSLSSLAPAGWHFHTTDHLGTVRLTVGPTGSTIESQKYWPYGDKVGGSASTLQKLSFASMERDSENNHYYDHARRHDFNLARFVSPDVLMGNPEDPQTWNRYTYARNNPQKYVDPDGKDVWDALAGGVNAFVSNQLAGVGRVQGGNADFRSGQSIGDVVSVAAGLSNIVSGATIDGAGIAALAPSAGTSAALLVVGTAQIQAGAIQATSGLAHLAQNTDLGPKQSAGGPGAGDKFDQATKDAERARNPNCVYCGVETTRAPGPRQSHIDHGVARSKGGNNSAGNANNSCRTCNLKKGVMTVVEFLKKLKTYVDN